MLFMLLDYFFSLFSLLAATVQGVSSNQKHVREIQLNFNQVSVYLTVVFPQMPTLCVRITTSTRLCRVAWQPERP